ncbi:MAG TPA: hypothetical protein VEV61_03320 [Streptosporangiaceae bacterium]|nr:hypothetical protein [Streptosporangiaceae bacterium]
MADNKAAVTPGSANVAGLDSMAARQRAADERDRLAVERQRVADEREAQADLRDRKADERETLADDREREANRRESEQTDRQLKLDERDRDVRIAVRDLNDRMLEAIASSRELLALSELRLAREEAGVRRAVSRRDRDQAEINRAAALSGRELAAAQPDASQLTERNAVLRKQARMALEALAECEEAVARMHEQCAARVPGANDSQLDLAAKAYAVARNAREIIRSFEE